MLLFEELRLYNIWTIVFQSLQNVDLTIENIFFSFINIWTNQCAV